MNTWLVTNRTTGELVYAYSAEAATEYPEYPYATFNHYPAPVPVAPVIPREVTKREWRALFTEAERIAIDRFNATFETNNLLTESQRDAVRSGLEDYKAASVVNKDDPATTAVLGLYTALGMLAAGRAAGILA